MHCHERASPCNKCGLQETWTIKQRYIFNCNTHQTLVQNEYTYGFENEDDSLLCSLSFQQVDKVLHVYIHVAIQVQMSFTCTMPKIVETRSSLANTITDTIMPFA